MINLASSSQIPDKPLAADHMEWFLAGSGKDYVEDRHLEEMLRRLESSGSS